jgi:feruloyl esterase
MRRTLFVLLFGTITSFPVPLRADSCGQLKNLPLADATITLAQTVAAGGLALSSVSPTDPLVAEDIQSFKNLPAFCRIAATIKPSVDSEIKIEIWMPYSGWNGKFLGVGNGAWGGKITYPGLAQGVRDGFAAASTDTGHAGTPFDASFALGHPEKLVDFGYRSVHLMTVAAKAVVAAFYTTPPRYSYFNGCSTGGQQALTEAQRFPDDYNGIVAGDPANFFTHLMFGNIWPGVVTLKDPASHIPPDKYPIIHRAVMKACDALDGVLDGIINEPERCHFDPQVLECKRSDGPDCLTSAQVKAVQQIYTGARNPRTGEQIFPGLEPGSPIEDATGDAPSSLPIHFFQYVLFNNPDWKWQELNFDGDVALADRNTASTLNAVDPNLSAFKAHGGKLLMYHGWSDPHISPGTSTDYYKSVVTAMGGVAETGDFARLFMVPGMWHCRGGVGPDTFDKEEVIEKWVEHGVAPNTIIASHKTNGVVDMTRPLCPYPTTAQWKGTGSTNDAANFACRNPTK